MLATWYTRIVKTRVYEMPNPVHLSEFEKAMALARQNAKNEDIFVRADDERVYIEYPLSEDEEGRR